ncbi:MEGF10_11 [Mytilus coruscus]|uniref:MEGF10_11 n=1 Tax=Mytilus coruscus TaxID=42192 RepID=A0A6J8DBA2_MYTCO|nr:MEGF10_11 [Mytilus coruscus]
MELQRNTIKYINQHKACLAGTFGKGCSLPCMSKYHGVQCKKLCNCTDNKKCDPVRGCVCDTGYTGSNCSNVCPSGRYGVNCSKECFCAHDADCDPVTADCLCSAGWFGPHCTNVFYFILKTYIQVLNNAYNIDIANRQLFYNPIDRWKLNEISVVSDEMENLNSEKDTDKSNTVMVYFMMAAALIGLVCVVTMVVKVKETLCHQVQKPKKDT